MINGLINIGQCLRLNSLRRIHHQHAAPGVGRRRQGGQVGAHAVVGGTGKKHRAHLRVGGKGRVHRSRRHRARRAGPLQPGPLQPDGAQVQQRQRVIGRTVAVPVQQHALPRRAGQGQGAEHPLGGAAGEEQAVGQPEPGRPQRFRRADGPAACKQIAGGPQFRNIQRRQPRQLRRGQGLALMPRHVHTQGVLPGKRPQGVIQRRRPHGRPS